ncbi:adenylate/guanylate cyclase domain-containing protein [Rhizobium leguminosarum]|uniref:adenylate/guanylate cyclase domain-containing protein n=1 Tax=Rhizobium leguminosarum TaxID=384 RepID=UPI001C9842B6|nr:adenylate/guanylate cyclase domain-containing protein [Rhizobium leguminosarum]MBY5551146.1 adenylate/guanylate cyclase domain-containing protein [Rhizobium leguminosarum]MBY5645296.1 adenylate/guanylate cyclase domain-containing protein [Rhizobium leguminosarum]
MERKLAAILAADVVGYSALMENDEAGTYERLMALRKEVLEPKISGIRGRIFKLMGDGLLAEFGSVVDAVECAASLQDSLAARNASVEKAHRIELRIGINLGEIIIDGDDRYGDSVNISARLQQLADPGGICVSGKVAREVDRKLAFDFESMGEQHVKNISEPIPAYRLVRTHSPTRQQQNRPLASPNKTSIAVLPFANMSGDPEQEYFADGLAEEIIVALGRLPGLLVIARNSSFAYRGSDVDVRKVGSDLNVRYVLSGSVRRGGSRLRMTAQMADAESSAHIWAETFDRELADVFAIQDEVTQRVVDALKLKLTPAQTAKPTGGGINDVEALDLLMRGRALLAGPTQNLEVYRRATDLIRRAIERDPTYVDALGALATAHNMDYLNRWTDDPDGSLNEAERLADRMVELAPDHAYGHFQAALTAMFARDFDRFRREAAIVIALNPDAGIASNLQGHLCLVNEVPLEAIPHYERAMRLDPSLDTTLHFLQFLGIAYFYGGRYETAAALFRERILLKPDTDWSRGYLASALGHLGKFEEARQVWAELMAVNPKYVLPERLNRSAAQARQIEMVLDGARKAGLLISAI